MAFRFNFPVMLLDFSWLLFLGHNILKLLYITEIYTKILEVNLFAFAYRLFRRDFSPLDGT